MLSSRRTTCVWRVIFRIILMNIFFILTILIISPHLISLSIALLFQYASSCMRRAYQCCHHRYPLTSWSLPTTDATRGPRGSIRRATTSRRSRRRSAPPTRLTRPYVIYIHIHNICNYLCTHIHMHICNIQAQSPAQHKQITYQSQTLVDIIPIIFLLCYLSFLNWLLMI